MIPDPFFLELWSEFVHELEGRTHMSNKELFSLIDRIYPKSIITYESRNFGFLTKNERNWLEKETENSKMEATEKVISKAEAEDILIKHETEWVVHLENTEKEKFGLKWNVVQHHWDKKTGF